MVWGGVFPRQYHLMLGNHAVTAAGAPPPPALNVSGFEDHVCMPVCLSLSVSVCVCACAHQCVRSVWAERACVCVGNKELCAPTFPSVA